MRDLVVVVPGITGSVLRRDGHDVWNLSLSAVGRSLTSFSAVIDTLRLPEDVGSGPAPGVSEMEVGGLITGWHLWPGINGGPGYRRLLKVLAAATGNAARSFAYDWRLSNRHTAHLLAKQVEGWLQDWRHESGFSDAKVIFVCHSMGGLAVRYYLEVLGGRENTRRMISIGTPYRGSVNAIRALTGDAFDGASSFLGKTTLIETSRTFPSLWELLPTYRCFAGKNGPVKLLEANLTDLSTDAIAHGIRFHEEIATAVARNSPLPYQLHAFAGKRQATWQSLTLDHGSRRYRREQRGEDSRGDGTVPLFSAVPPEWTNTEQAICRAARHGGLCSDSGVLDLVVDKIEPVEMGDVLAPSCELGLEVPDITGTDEPLLIQVNSDREDLLLQAYLKDPGTDRTMTEARMTSDGNGGYQASCKAIAGTWRIEVEAIAERPIVRIDDLVTVIAG